MSKTFNELTTAEKFEVVCSIKELRESLDRYVQKSGMDNINEKVNLLDCVDYQISTYYPSYMRIKGYWGEVSLYEATNFLGSLEGVTVMFGCAPIVAKQIKKCNKLLDKGSNLFVYEAKRLCEMYFDTEIKTELDYIENISYLTYTGMYKDEVSNIFDFWLECVGGLNITQDEDGVWVYTEILRHRAA